MEYEDTPLITEELVTDILKNIKEKSPRTSGIIRNLLLRAHKNTHKMYAEVYTACLATGYFPAAFKEPK